MATYLDQLRQERKDAAAAKVQAERQQLVARLRAAETRREFGRAALALSEHLEGLRPIPVVEEKRRYQPPSQETLAYLHTLVGSYWEEHPNHRRPRHQRRKNQRVYNSEKRQRAFE